MAKYDPTRAIVQVEDTTQLAQISQIKSYKKLFKNFYVINVKNIDAIEAELVKNKEITFVQKNYIADKKQLAQRNSLFDKSLQDLLFTDFNDPQTGKIWSFADATENGISVNKAYQMKMDRNQTEIIVAVVDTGVDYKHEDLKDVMWKNENEIPGNGIDDDNNGYIDDVFGIDTLTRDEQGVASGDPMDQHNHGTHVAGTIGATQNNNVGITGIASTAKIMAIRAVPNDGDETDIDVVESFLYAAKHGAKLINCSFGKKKNEGGMIVSEAIEHINEEYGTLVIAAAGNDSMFFGKHDIDKKFKYPASFENDSLLVIAASQKQGGLAYFSNVGKKNVDVAAPGHHILSTVRNNKYASYSGTSMAAPTTTGMAAHVLSYYPELSGMELKSLIMESVNETSKFKGYMVTGGQVDLFNALELASKKL